MISHWQENENIPLKQKYKNAEQLWKAIQSNRIWIVQ